MSDAAPIPCDRILVHYAEIGTKGGNRRMFEDRLRGNLEIALRGLGIRRVARESGRIAATPGSRTDVEEALDRLALLPGVAWAAPARAVEPDLDAIRPAVVEMAMRHPGTTFRISTRRTDKRFPHDSLEVNREVGTAVVAATGRKVSLTAAQVKYGIEIDKQRAYLYWDRREGPGGLPVGVSGTLVALVSGGIDSPVAAWRMMLRGCRIHLVHFLNRSVDTNRVEEKIRGLAARLALFHGPIRLSVVPFDDLQREIVMVVPAKVRMIVYRRAMFRIAAAIREEVGALGYVTGDSVGQVASQTLENLRAIQDAADHPVYAPLAGMSKREITDEASRIGTYEISILPHEDCCSFLVAKHPETRADLDRIRAAERFDMEAGVRAALAAAVHERVTPDTTATGHGEG